MNIRFYSIIRLSTQEYERKERLGRMSAHQNIASLVSAHTRLRFDTRSERYYGPCPFCKAATETLSVNHKENTFFCYACGAFGASSEFSARVGKGQPLLPGQKNPVMLQIYEDAASYYFEKLMNDSNPGLSYFFDRGLTKRDFEVFGLGFSPDTFSGLYKTMIRKYSHEELLQSGLFKISKKGYPYDLFRNRVMFPIMDENGDVIAFGGRVLDEDSNPKYMNSPETKIFSKRKYLYGFPYGDAVRREELLICEGYMDLIAVQKAGFSDSAAVLGTSLTEEHARLIRSYYRKVCLVLDSDAAGIHAAKRTIKLLNEAGLTVSVTDLRPAKDPDEFIRKMSKESFQKRVSGAVPSDQFLARYGASADEIIDILLRQINGGGRVET